MLKHELIVVVAGQEFQWTFVESATTFYGKSRRINIIC